MSEIDNQIDDYILGVVVRKSVTAPVQTWAGNTRNQNARQGGKHDKA